MDVQCSGITRFGTVIPVPGMVEMEFWENEGGRCKVKLCTMYILAGVFR